MMVKCVVCGTDNSYNIYGEHQDVLYYQCTNCEAIIKQEPPLDQSIELARYSEHNNQVEDLSYQDYFVKALDVGLVPFLDNKAKVLDFGSGPEPVLKYVLNNRYHVDVDIYDKYFHPDLNFLNNKYDVITTTEVVEHLTQPHEVFKLFSDLLNAGGILFVMTQFHNFNSFTDFSKWYYIRDITHVVFYNLKTFEELCLLYNFEIIYTNNKNIITLKKGVA